MLNVMVLAYQGRDAEEVAAGAVADHRRALFDTFLSEVLSRARPASRQYDSRTALRSLWCLAWWTRTRAGDRTAVPRWLTPNGWYGLSLPSIGYLVHRVCLPALFAGLDGGAALAITALYGVLAGVAVGLIVAQGIRLVKALPMDHQVRWKPSSVRSPASSPPKPGAADHPSSPAPCPASGTAYSSLVFWRRVLRRVDG